MDIKDTLIWDALIWGQQDAAYGSLGTRNCASSERHDTDSTQVWWQIQDAEKYKRVRDAYKNTFL